MTLDANTTATIDIAVKNKITSYKKELQSINERLLQIESKMMEQYNLNKVERLCDDLKTAILCHTLLYPDIVEFEQALLMLTSAKSVSFIMERLRRIKMLTDPNLMLDKQIRETASDEEILNAGLSAYSGGQTLPFESLNKNELTPLLIRHFIEMKMDYSPYFDELVQISQKIALTHNLTIDRNFAVVKSPFHTNYPPKKLEAVFDWIIKENYVNGGAEEKATFLSMFDSSITVAEKKINIAKKGKNGLPTVAWLYQLFTILLKKEELSNEEKDRISAFFLADGKPIEAGSIKSRNESKELKAFKNALVTILSS